MELRDYQADALERVAAAEARGVRAQLIVAATGLGKTVMFTELARRRGGRTLILAHRDELIGQAAAKVREVWPEAPVGIVKGPVSEVRQQVVVASVQTLARPARLAELTGPFTEATLLGRCDPFDLVVVDEAHHAAAESYRAILAGLRAGQDDGPLLVGVTATPDRGDGQGLHDVFAEIVSNHDMLWGIQSGYLSELRGLAVTCDQLDLGDVKVNRGDYDQGQAGALMESAGAPALIAAAWQQHALGRPTLVFTPTVSMAEAVARAFTAAGVVARSVDGSTPIEERRRTLRAFTAGTVKVVANCAVLTEGYDEPTVGCVVVARPTRSRALYTQMVGRGTRRHPDKADCLVMDVVGAADEHSLVTIPSLFGVVGKARRAALASGHEVSGLVMEDREEQEALGQLAAAEVELFRQVRRAGIAWVKVPDPRWPHVTRYQRSLGRDAAGRPLPTVILARTGADSDRWTAGWITDDGTKHVLIAAVTMELAQGVAEDYARKTAPHQALVATDAAWRRRPPTPKQRKAATSWGLTVQPGWTAGDLSDHLDARIAKATANRRRPT